MPPAKKATPRKRTTSILKPSPLRVELQDDNWAQLIDPARLTNGQRRPIAIAAEDYRKAQIDPEVTRELQRAVAQKNVERQTELIATLNLDSDERAELRVSDVMIAVLVEAWSLGLPLPSDKPTFDEDGQLTGSEVLEDITAWDYDALRWATARMMPTLKLGPNEKPGSRPT